MGGKNIIFIFNKDFKPGFHSATHAATGPGFSRKKKFTASRKSIRYTAKTDRGIFLLGRHPQVIVKQME